ncbi:DUF655 domain-containing protein [Stetteria hydrogenophila]
METGRERGWRPRRREEPRRLQLRPEYPDLEGVVLDFLESGYRGDPHPHHRSAPVAQVIGTLSFTLIDGTPLDMDLDFFSKVTIALEVPVRVPLGPSRGFARIRLACLPGAAPRKLQCYVADEVPEGDLELVRLAFEDPSSVELIDDYDRFLELVRSRGLPEKVIMSPPTPIRYEHLTVTAKDNLPEAVRIILREKESFFVNFFNVAEPINVRLHALELLKGVGKRTLEKLLRERQVRPFKSYEEVKRILKVDPVEALAEQILSEIRGEAKYYLFINPGREARDRFLNYPRIIREYLRRVGQR